jgi:dTDP-4-dehydrorhamnose reductase
MDKIVVTGADGQLGSELRRLSVAAPRRGEWVFTDVNELDITSAQSVERFFDREHPAVVVNCAAWTDVDGAERNPAGAHRINVEGVRNLARAADGANAVLIHISTDFVFDGFADTPYTETDTPNPINVYGETKLTGERAVLDSGCRGAVVRTSWLYSPYGRNFVKSIMGAAARSPQISVVADQWGCPTAADGLADAIIRMISHLLQSTKPAELYHYCDRGVVSRRGFAKEIVALSGIVTEIVPVSSDEYPTAALRPAYSALDTSKIERTFGIVPRPWERALAECMERIDKNR